MGGLTSVFLSKREDGSVGLPPALVGTSMSTNNAGEEKSTENEYHRRPDPSEPWRYACPECGSVDIMTEYVISKENRVSCKHSHCEWHGRVSDLVDRTEKAN
jgi:hypothetical protein